MFAEQISEMLEEEVQRRLAVYVKIFAEHFFTTEADLYKVILCGAKSAVPFCRGKSKGGKGCKNKGKHDGYCHLHKSQKPKKQPAREQPPLQRNNEQIGSSSGIVDEIF